MAPDNPEKKSRNTLADVGRMAQVSPATVSRALSGGTVNVRTRQRVLEAVKRLGYAPAIAAASLRGRHPPIIGVASWQLNRNRIVQTTILSGIASELGAENFSVILAPGTTITTRSAWFTALMEQGLLGGLISITEGTIMQNVYRRAIECKIPLVTVEYKWPGSPSVEIDQEAGGRLAAQHLAGKTREIAVIGIRPGNEAQVLVTSRIEGFRRELARGGVPASSLIVIPADGFTFEEGARIGKILARRKTRPLGVFVATGDLSALGIWRVMSAHGWRAKKDLFLVGYDDIPLSGYASPGLTTIGQKLEEMGRLAAQLVMRGFRGENVPPDQHVLSPVLISRETA